MKPALLLLASVLALGVLAMAQHNSTPQLSQHRTGDPSEEFRMAAPGTPPTLCRPCVFYGGDLDPSNANSAGLSDENTIFIPNSSTYGAVSFPNTVSIYGLVVNVQASAAFDPQQATYDIRTGISDGNGGTSVASGTANITVAATGRSFIGLQEYTVAVTFPTLVLPAGEYWFNIMPQCLNTLDGSCFLGRIFESNTTSLTNNVHGNLQPPHEIFLNSSFFGISWTNWCDPSIGLNSLQCRSLSFGVIGVVD